MFEEICPDCENEVLFSFGTKGNGQCGQCGGSGVKDVLEATINSMCGGDCDCSNCNGSGICPTCDGEGTI